MLKWVVGHEGITGNNTLAKKELEYWVTKEHNKYCGRKPGVRQAKRLLAKTTQCEKEFFPVTRKELTKLIYLQDMLQLNTTLKKWDYQKMPSVE